MTNFKENDVVTFNFLGKIITGTIVDTEMIMSFMAPTVFVEYSIDEATFVQPINLSELTLKETKLTKENLAELGFEISTINLELIKPEYINEVKNNFTAHLNINDEKVLCYTLSNTYENIVFYHKENGDFIEIWRKDQHEPYTLEKMKSLLQGLPIKKKDEKN